MKKTLLFLLTLSGLSALSTKFIREYHYVQENKTWHEAQSYCRENFVDLATVENQDDNNRLQSVLHGDRRYAWIGLYDHIKGWKWAMGNKDLNNTFTNWKTHEPDLKSLKESCTVILVSGLWRDVHCGHPRPAVCYHDGGHSKYILVQTEMNWYMAKEYCRSNYTDLVSVRNASENKNISSLVSGNTWIGLHRKIWAYWSDQTPKTFTKWDKKQPRNTMEKSCVVVNSITGTWWNVDCRTKRYFVCQTLSYPFSQKRFKLKFQSEADLNDPTVQQQLLEQLHAKLEKHALPDFKLRWMQTDGQTFHKEQKKKKAEGSCG